jgi:uncharacterized protein YybS (DUF2232 family)
MNILALLLDWFLHFDKKLLIVPDAIANFFIGIRLAFVNLVSSVGQAIVDFLSLVGTNMVSQGQAFANYLANLGNSIEKAKNWIVKFNSDSVNYAIKLYGWALVTGWRWLSQFVIALFMLSIEFLKDFGNTLVEYLVTALPNAATDILFAIPGFNLIPGIGAVKDGISKALGQVFKVGGSITPIGIDIGGAINDALNAFAGAVEDGVKDFFGL